MHLDTSRDVTPRARLGAPGGAPGMQAVLLEPRNKSVQVVSGSPPGQGTHGAREKRLRTSSPHHPSAVAKKRPFETALLNRYRAAPGIKMAEGAKK